MNIICKYWNFTPGGVIYILYILILLIKINISVFFYLNPLTNRIDRDIIIIDQYGRYKKRRWCIDWSIWFIPFSGRRKENENYKRRNGRICGKGIQTRLDKRNRRTRGHRQRNAVLLFRELRRTVWFFVWIYDRIREIALSAKFIRRNRRFFRTMY